MDSETIGMIALIIVVAIAYNWTEFTDGIVKIINALRGK